jgi:hypothetical protein
MPVKCETVAVLWIAVQEPFKRGGVEVCTWVSCITLDSGLVGVVKHLCITIPCMLVASDISVGRVHVRNVSRVSCVRSRQWCRSTRGTVHSLTNFDVAEVGYFATH